MENEPMQIPTESELKVKGKARLDEKIIQVMDSFKNEGIKATLIAVKDRRALAFIR